ncbi:MAG: hypothetical protein JW705_04625 [Methanosarcinaceae archaeon]|nr:hypothetical protein [Methanosarcinaceae archaeon]
MDPQEVLIIASVLFVVFVLLTAYFLKMAVLEGKMSGNNPANADPAKNNKPAEEEYDGEDGSVSAR